MQSPTFDKDGYPTVETHRAIESWPYRDVEALFKFIGGAWHLPDYFQVGENGYITASTCGWSGNESLMYALQQNAVVWALCWQVSHRGGHYEFEIPEVLRSKNETI